MPWRRLAAAVEAAGPDLLGQLFRAGLLLVIVNAGGAGARIHCNVVDPRKHGQPFLDACEVHDAGKVTDF